MKIKKQVPRIISGMLCFTMVFGTLFQAAATDTVITETPLEETGKIDGGDTTPGNDDIQDVPDGMETFSINDDIDTQSDGTRYETIEVTYSQASNYLVSIPKTISLGADKSSYYSIRVEGDIAANRQVCVVPVDEIAETEIFDFYMADQIAGSTKEDVVAEINQNKFYWDHEEAAAGYEETNNLIVADGLSAGRWKGTFQMEISMRTDPAHIHNYVGEVTKEPSCTEAGEKTYTCADCGDSYTESIDPTGHHYENGECADCGEKDPDHEHSYTEVITKEPTCTEAGEKKLTCSCGDTRTETIPAKGHNYADGECTDCGEKDPDYHKHSYTEAVTKAPTCTEAGEKTYTCGCGDSYTESIPATGHHYGEDDKCTDCGELDPDHKHNYTEVITKQPTCTEDGEKTLTCTCGDSKTESIPATGHHYGEDDKCTDCGIFNPDHKHSYTEEITKAPTCTEAGEKTLTCVCGDTKTESVPATGHHYVDGFCSGCGASDGTVIQVDITKTTNYVAKSRGYSFRLVVPDKEITCTMNANDQISLDGNTVTVAEDSAIGIITPVRVACDGKTYTVNVITAPDISDDSYEIYNSNDLVALGTIVNYSAVNDVNQNARLMNDIDLSDVCSGSIGSWTSIGEYHGVFDGQDYTINNLYIDRVYNDSSYSKYTLYFGLFSKAKDATIKNMAINGTVKVSSSTSPCMYVGGVCGYSTNTQFENITNNCTVTLSYTNKSAYTGGICGSGGTFVGCTNNGYVNGKGVMGGICGRYGSFTDCHNAGNVRSSSGTAGGICSESSYASHCSNTGTVTSSNGKAGGILGISSNIIQYCYNTGTISGANSYVGGIAAYLSGGSINGCYNTGNVTASASSSGYGSTTHAGGIAGSAGSSIRNCYNKGIITGYGSAGGIVGWHQSGPYITNCYNVGQYKKTSTGTEYGSIVGYAPYAANGKLTNCYSLSSRFQGGSTIPQTDCEAVDEETLKTYAEKLGDEFMDDTTGINDGYPVLKFQVE